MAHALYTFDLTQTNPHVQVTSTGTGNVATITPPIDAVAAMLQVSTNAGFITFDNSTPSSGNGLPLVKDTAPIFMPIGASGLAGNERLWRFASSIAGNAVLNVLFLV